MESSIVISSPQPPAAAILTGYSVVPCALVLPSVVPITGAVADDNGIVTAVYSHQKVLPALAATAFTGSLSAA